ncbi:MAG: penicillin-binding protein 1A [Firmicutes bacterium]|jgi:penicillin-binding protein 1A|nr:penicillin-binding protein 1A [Bacillota bacterium]
MSKGIGRILSILAISIIFVLCIGSGVLIGFVSTVLKTMPPLGEFEYRPIEATEIYDTNNKLITRLYVENRVWVPLSEIPKELQDAVIAIEDWRFREHHGVDFTGVARAILVDIRKGKIVQGASTLTQQLAKNAFLTHERTWARKLQELLYAIQLERTYTKDQILELYLNEVYFFPGQAVYGVEAAAQGYFGKSVRYLNLPESALLAGIIRNAYIYSPTQHPESAKARRAVVLKRMADLGYISNEQAKSSMEAPLGVIEQSQSKKAAPYFIDYVRDRLISKYGHETVFKGGLKIYTTLDLSLQNLANQVLLSNLPEGGKNAKGLTQPQAAMVVLDAKEGYIRAMIGGRGEDEFNRATMSYRQPGSAFKPFVYTAALQAGYTPTTLLDDSPIEYIIPGRSEPWAPVNNDNKFRGPVTVRKALEDSINVPSVKLLEQVGVSNAIKTAKSMGITSLVESGSSNDMNLSLVLGGLTRGVTPLEMASAYAVFANRGIKAEPIAILRVEDKNGNILERNTPKRTIVLDEQTAYVITDMLMGVIKRGTGKSANIGRPAAGKTGTTSEYTNAWFVGFTPDLVTCIWIGNDEQQEPMVYGGTRIGSSKAAAIWGAYMKEALRNTPISEFSVPTGIVFSKICLESGGLASELCPAPETEAFIEGTEPKNLCHLHTKAIEVNVCAESGQIATRYCPPDQIERRRYLASNGLRILPDGTIVPEESIPKESCKMHTWWTTGVLTH